MNLINEETLLAQWKVLSAELEKTEKMLKALNVSIPRRFTSANEMPIPETRAVRKRTRSPSKPTLEQLLVGVLKKLDRITTSKELIENVRASGNEASDATIRSVLSRSETIQKINEGWQTKGWIETYECKNSQTEDFSNEKIDKRDRMDEVAPI